jgi:hypothetical protein
MLTTRPQGLIFLSLFASASTLVCCALPALFVSLGMGAVLAGLVSDVPELVWLSHHKILTFGTAAIMLAISGGIIWRSRNLPCPVDPQLRRACLQGRRLTLWVYWLSVGLFLTGVMFAFVLPLII